MMNTKFILKGFWDKEPAYFVNMSTLKGDNIIHLSSSVDYAKKYDLAEDAQIDLEKLAKNVFKIYPICPVCGKDYDGHPAISRKDNKSEICSNCGVGEAFMDFIEHQDKTKDLSESVITFIETHKKATNL